MKIRIPSWEGLTKIGRSKAVTLTVFVPIIGYMIIFNNQLISWFELSRQVFPDGSVNANEMSKQSISRLYYFYFGLSFLGIASAIYQLVCPNLIKQHQIDRAFVVSDIDLMTDKRTDRTIKYLESKIIKPFAHELDAIKGRLANAYTDKKQAVTDLMLILWQHENWSSPMSRAVVFVFYILGFGVLAVPTIETFIAIAGAFYKHV